MTMNDMLKQFGDTGAAIASGSMTYTHPLADAIISECTDLLGKVPEGQRLLAYKQEKGITIDIITGKKVDWQVNHEQNKAAIFCPSNTKAVDIQEMTLALAMSIREIEHKELGIIQPNLQISADMGQKILIDYFLDLNMEMCKIVTEFETRDEENFPKFLDLTKKLGQYEFYRDYVAGKSQQELWETLKKTLTN